MIRFIFSPLGFVLAFIAWFVYQAVSDFIYPLLLIYGGI